LPVPVIDPLGKLNSPFTTISLPEPSLIVIVPPDLVNIPPDATVN
jgi:hypothetical protein